MGFRHKSAVAKSMRGGIVGRHLKIAELPVAREKVTLIRASRSQFWFGLSEFWKHRRLVYLLVWRDIKVRYKQTVLGALWAVLQPFLTMLVFTLVFGRLAKIPSDGIPYPVFFFCGLLPWQLFATGVVRSSNSLVENRYLVTRVYVPRLVLPVSAVLGGVPDFAVAFALLVGIMLYYRIGVSLAALAVLPLLTLVVATSLAAGLFLSALNVRYRDVGYAVPFLTQLWFFVTPIAYPSSLVSGQWRWLYEFNPMAGAVDGFRWVLLASREARGILSVASVAAAVVVLMLGFFYFQRVERSFADVV